MRKYSGASEVIDSIIVGAICTTCMRAGEDDEVVKTRGVFLLGNWKRAEPTGDRVRAIHLHGGGGSGGGESSHRCLSINHCSAAGVAPRIKLSLLASSSPASCFAPRKSFFPDALDDQQQAVFANPGSHECRRARFY